MISTSYLHSFEVFPHFLWDAGHEGELRQQQNLPRYYLLHNTTQNQHKAAAALPTHRSGVPGFSRELEYELLSLSGFSAFLRPPQNHAGMSGLAVIKMSLDVKERP